jgi:class 3 adenylate cyclase/tetratricopeptide (TPR) repeat protein
MPAEERKLATVLFADLVGSTELAGDQDPERVRALLDRFYDSMAAEIERAGGTVEKFVGDAVMAAFGAPTAHEDDAERALHVALAMQRRLAELFGDRLALRIGVNTGVVVVGRPREGSSFVTGDTVNICARLEQAAGQGEILVGERTVSAVRGAFEFGEPATVDAKGKPGGIDCRQLVRALSLMRPRGIGGLRPTFVGRSREVAQLQDAYGRVAAGGDPQLITIVGDAGVGKTRLVRELWQWLSTEPSEPLLRTGRCLSYGQGITYWPLLEVLKEHFGILESEPREAIAERVGERDGLAFTLGLAPPEDMHPLTVRERLHNSWVEWLGELVEERPVAILIEDLHWAELELCGLIEMLVERVRGPLLVLTTARPELIDRRPGLAGAVIRLEAFPPAGTAELIDALLGPECPAELRSLIVERAEGNPFFVEELIATLIDRGVAARRDGGWSFGELPHGFSVPDSVQAVLAARIDLLPPAEKAALQAAAVIGRVFWTGPVCELVEGDFPDFELLEEREFIRRRAGSSIAGEREYVVKHALTREVAYESLLKAKRAPLHASFASWLERTGDGADEHAAMLAYHYAEAVRPEDLDLAWSGREEEAERLRVKALRWLERAADLSVRRYEIDEGLSLLDRALELERDPPRQADLWHRIGHANALKFDGEAFWAAIEKAIEIGGPSADLQTELAFQSVRRYGMWKREPDPQLIEGWIERALELAEEGSPNQARALYARSFWTDDEPSAHALYEIAERLGDVQLRSLGLKALANAAWGAGELDQACAWTDRQLELLPELTDPDDSTRALLDAVLVYLNAGNLRGAVSAAALHVELAAGLTPHHRLHGAALQTAVEAFRGRWEDVRSQTSAAERTVDANLAAETPCPQNVSTLLHCAGASAYWGDEAESRRLEAKADAIGMEGYGMWFEPPRIRLALARNDLAALERLIALRVTRRGLQLPVVPVWVAAVLDALVALGDRERIEVEAPNWLTAASYAEPFALRALGVARSDETTIRQAAKRFEAMGLSWHAEQTMLVLSRGGPRR